MWRLLIYEVEAKKHGLVKWWNRKMERDCHLRRVWQREVPVGNYWAHWNVWTMYKTHCVWWIVLCIWSNLKYNYLSQTHGRKCDWQFVELVQMQKCHEAKLVLHLYSFLTDYFIQLDHQNNSDLGICSLQKNCMVYHCPCAGWIWVSTDQIYASVPVVYSRKKLEWHWMWGSAPKRYMQEWNIKLKFPLFSGTDCNL